VLPGDNVDQRLSRLHHFQLFFQSFSMETSSSDDDWYEDGLDEDDMGLIAEPD